MHSPVNPLEIGNHLGKFAEGARASTERIEKAHGNIRMCSHGREAEVFFSRIHVIDQNPHLYPAIGSGQQGINDKSPCVVRMPDVGLHINTALSDGR